MQNEDQKNTQVPEEEQTVEKEPVEKKSSTKKSTAKKSTTKKTATKKSTAKKSTAKKKTSKKASVKTSAKKTKSKTKTQTKKTDNTIEAELLKVTNIKSVDQIKKPKKIAFMFSFYAVIFISISTFCFIKFSKPKNTKTLLEESVNYEFLIEERMTEPSFDETELVDESEFFKESEETTEVTETTNEKDTRKVKETTKAKQQTTDRLLELTTKSANSYKAESSRKVEEEKETTIEDESNNIVLRNWAKRTNISAILPRFKDIIYSNSTFFQMTNDELELINVALRDSYRGISDKVFGDNINFTDKGKNGIIYLNFTYFQEFMEKFKGTESQKYESLKPAPYYNYIMDDKFGFNNKTYTTNLNMKLDFKNAKDRNLYYEIPATIYEPVGSKITEGGVNKINLRVLKNSKVGYTESFFLTGLLEVLDIECNTKHNPFFDISEVVGTNPSVVPKMKESGFDVKALIEDETFNYVLIDKKGYITALYMIKS